VIDRHVTDAERVARLLGGLLRRAHLAEAADVGRIVAEEAATAGAEDLELYLADYEQSTLVALHPAGGEALSIAGTVAGRAFANTAILRTELPGGGERVWLPMLDGTERIGVLGLSLAVSPSEDLVEGLERFAHLVAMLIVTKSAYSDVFELLRRRASMTVATELAWGLVPPLVFATDGFALAAMLEPVYDNGGDSFDYAVDHGVLHVGIFDAMGHGLAAVGAAAFAVSAYRHSRRAGRDLCDTHREMHEAVTAHFGQDRYVTALIAQLDLETGVLQWVSAGHPRPLLIRRGRRAIVLEGRATTPLGIEVGAGPPALAEESLEPGDLVLLFTDGLPEARGPDGELFTEERLAGFIEQAAAAGQIAPETLRRLRHAVLQGGATLRDDATAVLVEWRGGSDRRIVPPAALDDAR